MKPTKAGCPFFCVYDDARVDGVSVLLNLLGGHLEGPRKDVVTMHHRGEIVERLRVEVALLAAA